MKGLWGIGAACLLLAVTAAHADRLLIDKVHAEQSAEMQMPRRGTTMAHVRKAFGEPNRRIAPVGDPPIARWEYDKFVVYFERNRVIHAVMR